MFNTILFDLDGTLTDPFEGITNSVVYALKKFNITVEDRTVLKKFIGPPLYESFMVYYGFIKEKALKAVEYYREYYASKGIFECFLYEGILPLLQNLKDSGKQIVLATSKPELFAIRTLEHFKILQYFTLVAGATFDTTRIIKGDVIKYALEKCNIKDGSGALMIGDRMHDIIGAKQNGLRSVGVLYGYGGKDELVSAGADFIAETPSDILDFI